MKSQSKIGNGLRKLRKCKEIERLKETKNGFTIYTICGQVRHVHMGEGAKKPLQAFLKKYTSLKNFSF